MKDEGGRHHIIGELVTIEKEEMKNILETVMPVLRATTGICTFLLGPTPRYLTGKCCGNPTHLTNFSQENFAGALADKVRLLGRHLRSLVWHRQLGNIRVINTAELMGLGNMGNMSDEEATIITEDLLGLWGTDPVHPTAEAYSNLGGALLAQAAPVLDNKRKAETASANSDPRAGSSKERGAERRDHSLETSDRDYPGHYGDRDRDHSHERSTGGRSVRQRRDHSPEHEDRDHSRQYSSWGSQGRDHSRNSSWESQGRDHSRNYTHSNNWKWQSGGRGRGQRRGRRFDLN